MTYTKKLFADELLHQLSSGYDVVRIARWAFSIYMSHSRELELGLKSEIMQVVAMEEGPEFEMSEQELRQFASHLLH